MRIECRNCDYAHVVWFTTQMQIVNLSSPMESIEIFSSQDDVLTLNISDGSRLACSRVWFAFGGSIPFNAFVEMMFELNSWSFPCKS